MGAARLGRVARGLAAASGVAALVCIALGGCSKPSGGLVGVWDNGGGTIEFTADNHVKVKQPGRIGFTWYKVAGDQMTVGHLTSGMPDETVRYQVSGDTLTLGSSMTLGTMGSTTFQRSKGP